MEVDGLDKDAIDDLASMDIRGKTALDAPLNPELAHLVRNVRRTARPGAHVGVRRQVPRGFPVFCCRGGRCGPAVTGAVQPMLPAAGLPIRP